MNEDTITGTLKVLSTAELTTVVRRLHHEHGFQTTVKHHDDDPFVVYKHTRESGETTGVLWILGDEQPTPGHVDRVTSISESIEVDQAGLVSTAEPTESLDHSAVAVLTPTTLAEQITALANPARLLPSTSDTTSSQSQPSSTTAHAIRIPPRTNRWTTTTTNTTPPPTVRSDYWDGTHTTDHRARPATRYWPTTN